MSLEIIKNDDDYLIEREERNMDLDNDELKATREMNGANKKVMSEEEKIFKFIQQEYGNYDNYVRDLLDLYNKEKEKNKILSIQIIENEKLYDKETARLGNLIQELLEEGN